MKPVHITMNSLGFVLIQSLRVEQILRTMNTFVTDRRAGRINMFRLIRSTPEAGDCTCGYKVLLDKEYTVKSLLIRFYLKRKKNGDMSEFTIHLISL